MSDEDDATPDEPVAAEVVPEGGLSSSARQASVANRQRVQAEIVQNLKKMRESQPTLDVVHQILEDERLRVYADMTLGLFLVWFAKTWSL